ncbi:DNA polymerase IV [Lacibacterium aquatile]|uniref:DNA polymerase IV n=1 Tax=Lacibacterium aquatile TaxID=1168082 RepID=A0ABW5DYR6_9PROT
MADETYKRVCRDCGHITTAPSQRCQACGGRRFVTHSELFTLSIAHIDCDAFYASVEKRDNPSLVDQPVIVGGGGPRGVVSAACYIARSSGVRSAMPMFKALDLCPKAVVIPPNMSKYVAVGREVRAMMLNLTPLVEPLSIDEAFLDLTGTETLHQGPPARTLALFAKRVEAELGITVSIGLSHNKLLAKIASDLDKPRGFAIVGKAETLDFLSPRPVTLLWGVGKAAAASLAREGITTIGDIAKVDQRQFIKRHGALGLRLAKFARGEDPRPVTPDRETKSISVETTLDTDIAEFSALEKILWPLTEKLSQRLKAADKGGTGVTLKLKTADFQGRTRSASLPPTQLAENLWDAALPLLEAEADGRTRFRLIGIGCDRLVPGDRADPPNLLDATQEKRRKVETAMDQVRAKLGNGSIRKGRSF